MINLATSEMSPWITLLVTGKAVVNKVWNSTVPMMTFEIVAFCKLAPPIKIAATAGNAIIKGAM